MRSDTKAGGLGPMGATELCMLILDEGLAIFLLSFEVRGEGTFASFSVSVGRDILIGGGGHPRGGGTAMGGGGEELLPRGDSELYSSWGSEMDSCGSEISGSWGGGSGNSSGISSGKFRM
jgi:hypothetical protein